MEFLKFLAFFQFILIDQCFYLGNGNIDCTYVPNDDPNYGHSDIWQCGSPTNFCWLGHCTTGCCQNNNGESCCKGSLKCKGCDNTLIFFKPPGDNRRINPGHCSYSPT